MKKRLQSYCMSDPSELNSDQIIRSEEEEKALVIKIKRLEERYPNQDVYCNKITEIIKSDKAISDDL